MTAWMDFLWCLFHRRKAIFMFCMTLRGAVMSGREERLINHIGSYAEMEMRHLQDLMKK